MTTETIEKLKAAYRGMMLRGKLECFSGFYFFVFKKEKYQLTINFAMEVL